MICALFFPRGPQLCEDRRAPRNAGQLRTMSRFTVNPSTPVPEISDMEARIDLMPASYTMKGMLFSKVVNRLGEEAKRLLPTLSAPPRTGRYLPFSDYPQSDYSRLLLATAKKVYPNATLAEAHRRLARSDVEAFEQTTIGKVTLSAIRDPSSALLRMPDIYRIVMRGGEVKAEQLRANAVRLVYRDFYAGLEAYTVGTLEGLVMHYGRAPSITVDVPSVAEGILEVEWR